MEKHTHQLHQARVKNNCPLCYSGDGLEFTFTQQEVENKFYSKVQKEVSEKLYCHSCEQQIYPVNWNEDIERVHEYQKKLVEPKSTMLMLKPLAYFLILADAILIGVLIYYFR